MVILLMISHVSLPTVFAFSRPTVFAFSRSNVGSRGSMSLFMRTKKTVAGGDVAGRFMIPKYAPRTPNQISYVKQLNDPDTKIVVGVGAAGSGKTLFACCQAVADLKRGVIQKIIMTRPVVSVEEDIGFLPGSLIHKMDPWTRPIFDILLEFYSQKDIDSMLHGGVIEISPLGYMRGRTFKRAFILADEMQNSSPNQMLMLVTRIGEDSKMVITGDLKQSDRGPDNGLVDFLGKVKAAGPNQGFGYVELGTEDVQRSAIVARVLEMYSPQPVIKVASDIANKEKIRGAIQTLLREPDALKKIHPEKDATKKIHHDAAMLPNYEIPKNDTGKRV